MNGIKNSDMKSWMSSAFGGNDTNAQKLKPKRSTKRELTTKEPLKETIISKKHPKLDRIQPTKIHNDKNNNQILLAEKYSAKTRNDLVVNKSKVEQLSTILDECLKKKSGSIILIEGPAGCGKRTTLKVLCKEKQADLIEWNQPNNILHNFDKDNEMEYGDDNFGGGGSNVYESQTKLFNNFLFKSSRYQCDQIFANESDIRKYQVLFLSELPSFAFRDIKSFQQLLQNFLSYSKSSLVISLCTSAQQSNEFNSAKIFKADWKKQNGIQEITFNPIANSFVLKHLERIATNECLSTDTNNLNEICLISDGDLRQALNMLGLSQSQYKMNGENLMPPPKNNKKTVSKKGAAKSKQSSRLDPSENSLLQKKDANFNLFRGLGKILYRKNLELNKDASSNEIFFHNENKLPNHLKSKYREPLFYDPDDIVAKTPISSELMTLYLHQNYIDLYGAKTSGKNFEEVFETLNNINEDLMLTDMINRGQNQVEISEKYKELTALISVRSFLFHTYVTDAEKARSSRSQFMPLHKPYTFQMQELRKKRKQASHDLLIDNNNDSHILQLAIYLIEMESEFFTSILPYASMKKNRLLGRLELENGGGFGRGQFKQGPKISDNEPNVFMDDLETSDALLTKKSLQQINAKNLYEYEDDDIDITD